MAKFGRIPDDLLTERACPTCGSSAYRDELHKDHMRLVRCSACDLVYVNPAFNEDHYRSVYSSNGYQAIMRDLGEKSHDYRVERFGKERVELMARQLLPDAGPQPSYLDIGCSTGFVVEAAATRGWRAAGIDLNPSAVAFGRARGLDVQATALEDAGFPQGSFDAVSLFDVVEHLLFPRTTLDLAIRLEGSFFCMCRTTIRHRAS